MAKQLLDSSAAVDVYFKGAYTALVSAQHNVDDFACNWNVCACTFLHVKCPPDSINEGPETERSSDNLLCFPAEHTVYPMTVKTASNRFALKKRFSQFVTLDAQARAIGNYATVTTCFG